MYTLKENPIGIYEKAIPDKFDWANKIRIAKEAGFDFIEISIDESDQRLHRLEWSDEQRQYLIHLLNQHNMYINSMCLSAHRKYPFGSKDKKVRAKADAIMEKAIILAKDLGIRNIQLAGYDVYYEEADEQTKAYFIEGLARATKKAASANVVLSIEIMDTPFIGTISKCLEYIRLIDSPWLQIYVDLGNLTQWSEDPCKELDKGGNHIVGVHLKDTLPGKFKCVTFGKGTVNFEACFDKLKEMDYKGPFLIEMWANNDEDLSYEDSVVLIREAKSHLSQRGGAKFYAS